MSQAMWCLRRAKSTRMRASMASQHSMNGRCFQTTPCSKTEHSALRHVFVMLLRESRRVLVWRMRASPDPAMTDYISTVNAFNACPVTLVGVMLASLLTFIPELAAAVAVANTKIDMLDTRFDKLETKFDKLETNFDKLEATFDKGFEELKGSMRRMEGTFVKVSAKLQEDDIKKFLDAKKDQTKLHSRLSSRVKKLEEQVIPK